MSASDAEILLLGSKDSILSSRSSAVSGINGLNSSRTRRRYCFLLCLTLAKFGKLITSGQLAGHGVPHSLDITTSCANSSLAYSDMTKKNSSNQKIVRCKRAIYLTCQFQSFLQYLKIVTYLLIYFKRKTFKSVNNI